MLLLCNHTCYAFMSLRRLVTSNGGQYYARDKSSNVTLLEERTPGLDEKTIILDIVKLIYVFKNNLPDQKVAIFALSSKLTPWKVIFNVQPLSALQFPGPLDPPPPLPPPRNFQFPLWWGYGYFWNHTIFRFGVYFFVLFSSPG